MKGRLVKRAGDVPALTLWSRIREVALTDVGAIARAGTIQGSLEQLEEILLEADFGVAATMRLVAAVESQAKRGLIRTEGEFQNALSTAIEQSLRAGNSNPRIIRAESPPTVVLVVGINGAGKTTFIGKFTDLLAANNMTALVGAADTFRAGAIDQLRVWAERSGAGFVGGKPGTDPASVAFDAVDAGIARGVDVVAVDTAGRLHTKINLMGELEKVKRSIAKHDPKAPHETLLVVDATTGSNALAQAKEFHQAVGLTGLIVTKLDGSGKGGVVIAIQNELGIP
ncbi:MAG: signal recognition particle-docking protein FtsY, partial [Gemmatimonadota bacterium]|nr:signal recognition particle-docking protein FtsY [Gemmatimonadota bacterium]